MSNRTLAFATLLGFAGCSGSNDTLGHEDMASPPIADMASSSALVGSGGGSVSLPDGTKVDVPAGALSSDTTITIMATATVPAGSVGPAYVFGPEGQTFAKPVSITVPFVPSMLPTGTTAANVTVMTSPVTNPTFTSLGGAPADASHITAQTPHFSIFGAAAAPASLCTGNAVKGTFGGYSISNVVESEAQTTTNKGVFIYLADAGAGQVCGGVSKPPAQTTIEMNITAKAVGTYMVGMPGAAGVNGSANWFYYNAAGQSMASATSGTITVSSISANSIVGSYDLMFGSDHVTGCFSTASSC
ncbi:MAG: hypothetical protein JWN44_5362 [Myxococcales bacterium]|nr:hypothetical protein [Myxococcales bacterium]